MITSFIFHTALEQLLTSDLNKTTCICIGRWETVCPINSWWST